MRERTEIIVVPHTHWDREWYEPFQRFRLRLVALLDDVFERMERDPRQRFTLDGQLAAVDDYLEVRPERREQVVALVSAGRLAIGPWQILLDEFLCSGENIVRNLERGLTRSAELGGAMPVGYLPDMFGHIAQMPQILAGAGLAHACVWRGVPERVRTDAFAWEAPDGTVVRTEYLCESYGNAAGLMDDLRLVTRRATDLAGRLHAWRPDPDGGPMLGMYGTDHAAPSPDAPDMLAAAGVDDMRLRLGTLTEYFATRPTEVDGLPVVRGELRSHARANILPGVISVRGHLKQAMSRAERRVERYAEPLAALSHDRSVQRFLDMAWTRLIDASCHDSVTGCGCDETAEQVAARLAEADQLGRAVCDLVGARLAAAVPRDGHLLLNPTPAPGPPWSRWTSRGRRRRGRGAGRHRRPSGFHPGPRPGPDAARRRPGCGGRTAGRAGPGSRLAAAVPRDGHLLLNPTPAPRTALVTLDVEGPAGAEAVGLADTDGHPVSTQVLDRARTLLADDLVA
ncbi:hypothetical protein JNW88_27065, partial [Micromonospora sp. ATA32]|nr:hypothetical protein [Micromonospora sp. ATA32]